MSNELERRLRAALSPTPAPDAELERRTMRRVRQAVPPARSRRRRIAVLVAQGVVVATVAGVLVLALPRGGHRAAVAPSEVLTVAGADPATGLFDPQTALRDLRGRVVVMAFVTRGCAPCADVFGTADDTFAERATFVQVLSDATIAQGRRISEGRLPAAGLAATPTAVDGGGALAARFDVTVRPTVVVLSKDGREAARFTENAAAGLTRVLPALVQASAPAGYPKPRPAQLDLAVFATTPADAATIPEITRHALMDHCQVVPGTLRLAARGPLGARIWVARSMDGGLAYASTYGRGGRGGGIGCGTARYQEYRDEGLRKILGSGIVTTENFSGEGRWGVAILVTDRWTELRIAGRRIPIATNGAIITGAGTPPTRAVLVGPGGSRSIRFLR